MSEEEKEVIKKVRKLLLHKNDYDEAYGEKIYRPYAMSKEDYEPIEKLLNIVEGQECVIETQAHNEEVLMEYFNRHTCLHCGEGKPGYCEECYQKLIGENAKLQEERDGIYNDYQDLGKVFYQTTEQLEIEIKENTKLKERIKELEIIEAEHKRLNGELRVLLGLKGR